ncbi:MAG: inositol monophosphatase family protein [Eubacteriales bacterium]|nr:inositol monophosphatase family protein [Eubacteriales bacterium]
MSNTWNERLAAAQSAARKAGEYLLSRPSFSVMHKLANDYVTEADQTSESIIRSELLSRFPDDGFFGEESGESAGAGGRWIVDPIDGTANFICDLPLYTISIAYEEAGEIVVGCVFCPRLDEMYTAVKGQGAFLNGEPIRPSQKTVLRDAIVGMSFAARYEDAKARMLPLLPALLRGVSDLRRLGSAALDLCLVACGRYDAFLELHLFLYDIAAGMLIAREAGAVVSGWPGDELPLRESGNTFACCPALYPALYELIASAEQRKVDEQMQKTDAIIILGHRLEPGDKPSDDLVRRIDCAVEHWKETNAPLIMPCGGLTPGHEHTEAEVMRDMLVERGVPAEIIRLEDKSRVTIENVVNAKGLLAEGARVALVTSDYHVERALDDCRRAGLEAYGVGAQTPPGEYRDQLFAKEKEISEYMNAARAQGLSDEDIMRGFVEEMRRRAAERGLKFE